MVAAPVYAAEDLYLALSDEEREIEAVKTAYSSLTALIISMQLAMQNPTAPGESSSEPELDEISTVLYGDLPDAPTGSYIGEYVCRLPPATPKLVFLPGRMIFWTPAAEAVWMQ